MKKIFTLLLILNSMLIFAQQIPRQKVIVEVGTGTWCSACPAVVEIIHDLEAEEANIAVIEYHINDSYQNSDASIRNTYYDFPWYPTTYYDSKHIGYDDWATYSIHKSYYQERQDSLSSFGVSISGELSDNNVSGQINAYKVADYEGQNLVMHLVITESNIPENWQGETELDYVERMMYPNGNGTPLDFSDGSFQKVEFTFEMDPLWVKENCEITFFVQDVDTVLLKQDLDI